MDGTAEAPERCRHQFEEAPKPPARVEEDAADARAWARLRRSYDGPSA
jgi:hypothetical protein